MSARRFSLPEAFDLHKPALVAFVGGGGKSSLMFALSRALSGRVVMTTTTRIFAAQMNLADAVCYSQSLEHLDALLEKHHRCLLVGAVSGDKAVGVDPLLPGRLLARPDVDFVLVEADGSRMLPIKAPAAHEPVLPPQTSLLVPVVGIDALNGRIGDVAHRPELVRQLLAVGAAVPTADELLDETAIAALVAHPQGGLKNAPEAARIIPFINKVETDSQLKSARKIAREILRFPRIDSVLIGATRHDGLVKERHRRVTAVVLAAGTASRMGRTKQLLPWGVRTVLGQTLHLLKESAVNEIVVVTGHDAESVSAVAREAGVATLLNPDYASGEILSSLKTAVGQLPAGQSAVLVMLADQPMVEPETIDQLLAAYWQGAGSLIAPSFQGKRGNPVLIDRRHWAELQGLPGDAAPRHLLQRHPEALHLVEVDSDAILRDLDSQEDYQRWRPQP